MNEIIIYLSILIDSAFAMERTIKARSRETVPAVETRSYDRPI